MTRQLRVLVVEDVQDDVDLLLRNLSKGGYQVAHKRVDTRDTMIAAIEEEQWDLLISDYNLPQFSGEKALEIYHEQGLDVPFIVISGVIGEEVAVVMMKSGAHDYIMKDNLTRLVPAISRELNDADVRKKRRLAELELKQNEQKLRLLVHSMSDTVFVIDSAGLITEAYSAEDHIPDKKLGTLSGVHVRELFNEDVSRVFNDAIQTVRETGRNQNIEYSIETQNGLQWHSTTFDPHEDGQQVVVVARNITRLKEAERVLTRKNVELSEFVHAMAHDLRGSLHKIQSYAELMKDDDDPSLIEKISQISGAVGILLDRSVVLADAGLVIEKTDNVELDALVVEVADTVVPKNIKLIKTKLPEVMGDAQKISQVFTNLISNAVEHGAPKCIEVKCEKSENGLSVLISNDGTPIPEDSRDKVFKRGYSTKKRGSGLGLSIVRKIVEAHGWEISLEVEPQTTFRIFIPLVDKTSS